MAITTTPTEQQTSVTNRLHHGDCINIMRQMPAKSVDFILTDPPYLVNYRDRSGRSIHNDVDDNWLKPAMNEAYRVLKQNRVAVMFYGWTKIDKFFEAWLEAGFRPIGHIVFRKNYASNSRFLRYQHEQAFLLAKGRPPLPNEPLGDVMEMPYSGNKLHPTQKPVPALVSLIAASHWWEIPYLIRLRAAPAPAQLPCSLAANMSPWRWIPNTFNSPSSASKEFNAELLQDSAPGLQWRPIRATVTFLLDSI